MGPSLCQVTLNHGIRKLLLDLVDIFEHLLSGLLARHELLLLSVARRHRLEVLLDELVVGPQLVSERALDEATHVLQLSLQAFQLAVARLNRLLHTHQQVSVIN